MTLANSINTVMCQQSIFHKTSTILLYILQLHVPTLWLTFFSVFDFSRKTKKKLKNLHSCPRILCMCMMRSEEKAAIVDITDYYQKMHKNASKHYARTCYTKLF